MSRITRRSFLSAAAAVVGALALGGCTDENPATPGGSAAITSLDGTGSELCGQVKSALENGAKVRDATWKIPAGATVDVSETHTGDADYWIQADMVVPDSMSLDMAKEGIKAACAVAVLLASNPIVEKLVFNCHNESGTSLYQIVYVSPWPEGVGPQDVCIQMAQSFSW